MGLLLDLFNLEDDQSGLNVNRQRIVSAVSYTGSTINVDRMRVNSAVQYTGSTLRVDRMRIVSVVQYNPLVHNGILRHYRLRR